MVDGAGWRAVSAADDGVEPERPAPPAAVDGVEASRRRSIATELAPWQCEAKPADKPAATLVRTVVCASLVLAGGVVAARLAGRHVDLVRLMAALGQLRPVFHAEADFRHAFAWALQQLDARRPRLRAG
jgi:hypothetical protein